MSVLDQVRAAASASNWQEAAAVAEDAAHKGGIPREIAEELAKGCFDAGLYAQSLQWAERLARTDPYNAGYSHALGMVRRKLGDFDGAREAQQTTLSIEPDHKQARTALTKIERDSERRTAAETAPPSGDTASQAEEGTATPAPEPESHSNKPPLKVWLRARPQLLWFFGGIATALLLAGVIHQGLARHNAAATADSSQTDGTTIPDTRHAPASAPTPAVARTSRSQPGPATSPPPSPMPQATPPSVIRSALPQRATEAATPYQPRVASIHVFCYQYGGYLCTYLILCNRANESVTARGQLSISIAEQVRPAEGYAGGDDPSLFQNVYQDIIPRVVNEGDFSTAVVQLTHTGQISYPHQAIILPLERLSANDMKPFASVPSNRGYTRGEAVASLSVTASFREGTPATGGTAAGRTLDDSYGIDFYPLGF